jgi:hypothetical protein
MKYAFSHTLDFLFLFFANLLYNFFFELKKQGRPYSLFLAIFKEEIFTKYKAADPKAESYFPSPRENDAQS